MGCAGVECMIKEGAIGDVEAIIGLEVDNMVPTGTILVVHASNPKTRPTCKLEAVIYYACISSGDVNYADPILTGFFLVLSLQGLVSIFSQVVHCPPHNQVYIFIFM